MSEYKAEYAPTEWVYVRAQVAYIQKHGHTQVCIEDCGDGAHWTKAWVTPDAIIPATQIENALALVEATKAVHDAEDAVRASSIVAEDAGRKAAGVEPLDTEVDKRKKLIELFDKIATDVRRTMYDLVEPYLSNTLDSKGRGER